jgi:hypothetical protein
VVQGRVLWGVPSNVVCAAEAAVLTWEDQMIRRCRWGSQDVGHLRRAVAYDWVAVWAWLWYSVGRAVGLVYLEGFVAF